ncbi:ComEC/Rec2 family competence protein [Enterococcus rivorum]|uniref:ComEC/Rec2 family competence protein n=1 Tax=Enterococcus rivorum TaxID=762845 RepID=UPI003639D9FE
MKVGHHGSKTSTTDSFVQNFQPKEAIISCGRNNRFKHPNEETIQVLERNQTSVFRTDTMGMIYYEWYGIGTLHQAKIIKEQD